MHRRKGTMEQRLEKLAWSVVWLLLMGLPGLMCSAKHTTMLTLDSQALCRESSGRTIHWASKQKDVIVVGKGAEDRPSFNTFTQCSVVIGAATAGDGMLQLRFEAFYVKDCGVTLMVNQSQESDFPPETSSHMATMGCGHSRVAVLHSKEKHYVKIGVHKEKASLQEYNFRINITVIDKLPETGPEIHVVIIVGVTVVIVVATALWLLVKYLLHRSQRWQEHCAERNMERAIRLYNSQETPQESDYMYTALPPHDIDYRQGSALSSHRNSQPSSKHAASVRGGGRHHRPGDITFVHADGHIETFHRRLSPQERRHCANSAPEQRPAATTTTQQQQQRHPSTSGPVPHQSRDRGGGGSGSVEGSAGGECPPSYEEALRMPTMHEFNHSASTPHYINVDDNTTPPHPQSPVT